MKPHQQFRRALPGEMEAVYLMGFDAWSDGQSREEYLSGCRDSPKYRSGRWFVLMDNDVLRASLLVHDFQPWGQQIIRGIGSVATFPEFRGQGCGHAIVQSAVSLLVGKEQAQVIFLYSDIGARFYEKDGFRSLPGDFQTSSGSILMARMFPEFDDRRLAEFKERIPSYF